MLTGPFTRNARVAALALSAVVCGAAGLSAPSQAGRRHRPFPEADHVRAPIGSPLAGLTPDQAADFASGLENFTEIETMDVGLGPVFNARGCAECHVRPAVGGAGADLALSRVTRVGRLLNGVFDPLADEGGMLLQARSVHEIDPSLPISGETVPADATLVSHRITTPLFGAGLIEAIPAAEILRRADPSDRNADGIAGVPNLVVNPETGQTEVGRFGWKAHVSNLHVFTGDAYLNEMGITSASFPDENLPQGQPIYPGCDLVTDIEADEEDVARITTFMRFLAPPPAARLSESPSGGGDRRGGRAAGARPSATPQQGQRVFAAVGCASCHTPSLQTGASPVAALRNRTVPLYSDLLLHDLGDALADGMVMGSASGRQWRTAPLWGLSGRRFFLHDGRATTPEQAVLLHGGEAANAVARVRRLSPQEGAALSAFLASL